MPPDDDKVGVGVSLNIQAWDLPEGTTYDAVKIHEFFCEVHYDSNWDNDPAVGLLFASSDGDGPQKTVVGVMAVDNEHAPVHKVLEGVLPELISVTRKQWDVGPLLTVTFFVEAWQHPLPSDLTKEVFDALSDDEVENMLKVAPRREVKIVLTIDPDSHKQASILTRGEKEFHPVEPTSGQRDLWQVLEQAIGAQQPPEIPGAL